MYIPVFTLVGQTHTLLSSIATVADQPVDQTGISSALIAIARIGVSFLVGILTLLLVVYGYQYMTADESVRGSHLKRGISTLLGGAVLVVFAVTLAPQLVTAIVTGSATAAPVAAPTQVVVTPAPPPPTPTPVPSTPTPVPPTPTPTKPTPTPTKPPITLTPTPTPTLIA